MDSRERVTAALHHSQPDFTPCDYFSTPEIHAALKARLGVSTDAELLDRLGVDIRYVNPPYRGPALPSFDDGSTVDTWGIRKKRMPNEYGDYAEPVNFPYAAWTSVEEAAAFPWPSPADYDYDAIPAPCGTGRWMSRAGCRARGRPPSAPGVHRLMEEVGRGGGYILAPSHNIQPDTPTDNVLAVYSAVAEARGKGPVA